MQQIIEQIGENRFLLGIANLIAGLTAFYFVAKALVFTVRFAINAYKTSIKTAIIQIRLVMSDRIAMCADNYSYFFAYIIRRVVLIFVTTLLFLMMIILRGEINKYFSQVISIITFTLIFTLTFRIQHVVMKVMNIIEERAAGR